MRINSQTLQGMSKESLKEHYDAVKNEYNERGTPDSRTRAYLMTIDSYIQMNRGEE
ncbi:hypothetical protein [Halobacillus seohaensis]|uniref:Integrase n=1 Tax=Halobacillus seohaensis TaxID=447421 RepID=A0ABW2EP64_9BACI